MTYHCCDSQPSLMFPPGMAPALHATPRGCAQAAVLGHSAAGWESGGTPQRPEMDV